ncbi:glycosyltransferase family 2 protein [Oceanispirochaeta sp. M1]|nr:glycosyltransferase [Oceanispirochaeta sp. M1]
MQRFTPIEILSIISIIICSYYLLLTIVNVLYMMIRTKKPSLKNTPKITVMVPARNEENNIRACVESLLSQDYPDFEVMVIDDNSTDNTAAILKELSKRDDRLTVYTGSKLPEGWYGKPWALQQLSHYATGEYYLFTDADTVHKTNSLSFIVTNMLHHKADLISALPNEIIKTFGELINVPALYVMTTVIMPLPAIDLMKWKEASYCLGQYFCIKADVYKDIDGFEHVRHLITEDVAFGKEVKRRGYKTLFLDGQKYVDCHMYSSYIESFKGFGKNIYSSVGFNLIIFSLTAILIFMTVNFPFGVFIASLIKGTLSPLLVLPTAIFTLAWTIVTIFHKLPWYNPVLYPLQYTNLLIMAIFYTIKFRLTPGISWKGRVVK